MNKSRDNIMKIYTCPDCGGDGKETCHNPDHGFISALSFRDEGRLGCPVCGHDENHKVIRGGLCLTCNGKGMVTLKTGTKFLKEMDYDFELEELGTM